MVTPCDGTRTSEKWCCGRTRTCCDSDSTDAVFIAPTLRALSVVEAQTVATSSPASSAVPTSAGLSTTLSPSLGTPTGSPTTKQQVASPSATDSLVTTKKGLSTGAKAGIGVGAVAGALLLLGLGFFVAKALQWKRRAAPEAIEPAPMYRPTDEKYAFEPRVVGPLTELSATPQYEMSGSGKAMSHHQLP